ncbi:MAG: LTA synthase family protein [Caldilineaceae bacterium]
MLAPNLLTAGFYDIAYSLAVTLFFVGAIYLARKRPTLKVTLLGLYLLIAVFSVFMAALNFFVIRELQRPFNYQIFYYSDFLTSRDAYDGIFVHLTPSAIVALIGAIVAMAFVTFLLFWAVKRWWARLPRWTMPVAAIAALLYFPLAGWHLQQMDWDHFRLVNPIVWFADSIVQAQLQPGLFTMEVPEALASSSLQDEYLPGGEASRYPAGKIKNVIFVTMESVGQRYLPAFGAPYDNMPELDHYLSASVRFPNIYASAPTSNKSLVSILASIYPWLSYAMLTKEYPDFNFPTLSSELHNVGYRTAFLSAGDTRYEGADKFLSYRKFDRIENQESLKDCGRPTYESSFAFMNGVDEMCLVDSMETWIDEAPQQPFFAMLWTQGTHYPYYTIGEERDFGVQDAFFNRYLNALQHTDAMIGRLLDSLKRRSLLDSTLVVIYGDHGEAFGQHNQEMHAWNIYEENVHIPLILINPQLFHGEQNETVGGLLDLAPTVMELLGQSVPEKWQGRNLLRPSARARVYFYAPWWDTWFGYREGNYKVLYNGIYNKTEIYDLSTDPGELTDLSTQKPEMVEEGVQYLSAWVQHQTQFVNREIIKADQ